SPRPPSPLCAPLFPYTTLFRSVVEAAVLFEDNDNVGDLGELRLARLGAGRMAAEQRRDKCCNQCAMPKVHPVPLPPCIYDISIRSEEHTSELQSLRHLVCRLLL